MRKNYRNTLSNAKAAMKKPNWMGNDVWADFLRVWDSEEVKVSYICLLFNLKRI